MISESFMKFVFSLRQRQATRYGGYLKTYHGLTDIGRISQHYSGTQRSTNYGAQPLFRLTRFALSGTLRNDKCRLRVTTVCRSVPRPGGVCRRREIVAVTCDNGGAVLAAGIVEAEHAPINTDNPGQSKPHDRTGGRCTAIHPACSSDLENVYLYSKNTRITRGKENIL